MINKIFKKQQKIILKLKLKKITFLKYEFILNNLLGNCYKLQVILDEIICQKLS